jgi:hypothetical protein
VLWRSWTSEGKRRIFSIEVLGTGAVGSQGVRVGDGFDKLDLSTASCRLGQEEEEADPKKQLAARCDREVELQCLDPPTG